MEKRETLLKAVKDTAEVLMGQAGLQDESTKGGGFVVFMGQKLWANTQ